MKTTLTLGPTTVRSALNLNAIPNLRPALCLHAAYDGSPFDKKFLILIPYEEKKETHWTEIDFLYHPSLRSLRQSNSVKYHRHTMSQTRQTIVHVSRMPPLFVQSISKHRDGQSRIESESNAQKNIEIGDFHSSIGERTNIDLF